jgi:hypothetical protein
MDDRDSLELLRLRAQARALLESSSGPINFCIYFATSSGRCESHTASGPGGPYNRLPAETMEEFKTRVFRQMPATPELPYAVVFWADPDPNDPLNSDSEP